MGSIRLKTTCLGLLWLTLVFLLSGCLMKTTPPGPNSAGGSVEGVPYSFHQWAQGLSVMIWHDLSNGTADCSGTGSTSDPVYREACRAEAEDGRSLEWQIHTTDGVRAEMWINGDPYELANGNLFLIDTQDGTVHVVQLQRDLSNLAANHERITAFAQADLDVSSFIESVKSRLTE